MSEEKEMNPMLKFDIYFTLAAITIALAIVIILIRGMRL